jgi:transposase
MGVDVHTCKHVVTCKIDGEFTNAIHIKPEVGAWEKFIARFPGCELNVVYEAGLTGYNLYDWLTGLNGLNGTRIRVCVAPPAKIPRAAGDRVKTDRRDTIKLIHALENKSFKPVVVPNREQREERELVRERERALKHLKGLKNEIHGFLKFHGVAYAKKGSWGKAWLEAVEAAVARRDTTGLLKKSFAFKLAAYHHAHTSLADLTKAAKRLFKEGACALVAQAIAQADGVGWLSAVTIAVETPDFLAFKNSEAYAASTGTVPSESSSGESVRRGAITRAGNRHVRRVLTECAWVWIRKDEAAARKYHEIKAGVDSRKKIAIVAMMRRLAVKIYHLARTALLDQLAAA